MKKILVVGFGSIGKRHSGVYESLRAQVAVVSSRENETYKSYSQISSALKEFSPDVVVISNETCKHEFTLKQLQEQGFKGIVVVEKPLAEKPIQFQHDFKALIVSYNLRESEVLKRLKQELNNKKVITAQVYCGQYLPDWRPGRDYRKIYSAHKSQGGGVLRDLSHELDYMTWIFGKVSKLTAMGGHLSTLEIDSDDVIMFLAQSEKCSLLSVTLNYLDRIPKRELIVNCEDGTYYADLVRGYLKLNNEMIIESDKVVETYQKQARHILSDQYQSHCTFQEANEVLKLIEAIEKSYTKKEFVTL
jgi:predicted dehydrogenase